MLWPRATRAGKGDPTADHADWAPSKTFPVGASADGSFLRGLQQLTRLALERCRVSAGGQRLRNVIEWTLRSSLLARDPSALLWPLISGYAAYVASCLKKSSSRNFCRRWSAAMLARWRCSVA